jgi:hypothetical protein
LESLLDEALALSIQREKLLEARAAEERRKVPKFENSAQADIARVFIDDLTRLRKAYLDLVVQQLDIREAGGMETESLLQLARERTSVAMEFLAGQVTLDAMSLGELRAQLAEEPLDEDLRDAFRPGAGETAAEPPSPGSCYWPCRACWPAGCRATKPY